MTKNLKERIALLQKEQEQLKAKAQQLKTRFNVQERKTIDRRKFVAGALILKDIETNAALRNHIIKLLADSPERDKKLFLDLLPVSVASQIN